MSAFSSFALSVTWRLHAILRPAVVGTVLLLVAGTLAAADAGGQEKKLKQLRERISGLQQNMQKASGERSKVTKELQAAEKKIGKLARRLRVLTTRLKRQRDRLGQLKVAEGEKLQHLDQQKDVLAKQVRAAYAMGRQERIKILFNQQDPDTVARVMTYYDYLNRARVARAQQINVQLQELRVIQEQIHSEEAKLHGLKQQSLAEKVALEETQSARRKVIASISKELSSDNKALKRLRADEKSLQQLLSGIREALADVNADIPGQQPFSRRKGRLPWPSRGVIEARYGAPKIGNLRWDGMLIGAPEGREIKAVHRGRVAYADWLRGFGLLLIIDHGDGYMTLYGHNQSLFKETGDWVEAGEAIALVGSSGGKSRSGVYFGIRYKGKAVNPIKWCRRPSGRRVG